MSSFRDDEDDDLEPGDQTSPEINSLSSSASKELVSRFELESRSRSLGACLFFERYCIIMVILLDLVLYWFTSSEEMRFWEVIFQDIFALFANFLGQYFQSWALVSGAVSLVYVWREFLGPVGSVMRLRCLGILSRHIVFSGIAARNDFAYSIYVVPFALVIAPAVCHSWIYSKAVLMSTRSRFLVGFMAAMGLSSVHFGAWYLEKIEWKYRQKEESELQETLRDRKHFVDSISHVMRNGNIMQCLDSCRKELQFTRPLKERRIEGFEVEFGRIEESVSSPAVLGPKPFFPNVPFAGYCAAEGGEAETEDEDEHGEFFSSPPPTMTMTEEDDEPEVSLDELLGLFQSANDSLLSTTVFFEEFQRLADGTFVCEPVWTRPFVPILRAIRLQDRIRLSRKGRPIEMSVRFLGDAEEIGRRCFVKMDAVRVFNVVTNIVSNALKYTSEGQIEIEIGFENKPDLGGECISFVCRDTGIGIDPERLHLVFVPYSKVNSQSVQETTNLGLCISKQVIERLGGELEICSDGLGSGSTGRFLVPIREKSWDVDDVDCVDEDSGDDDEIVQSDYPIFLVEDDLVIVTFLTHAINQMGYFNVESARNGQLGYELIRRYCVDSDDPESVPPLVLMDVNMPVMNGYETTRKIREAGLPCTIIACTGATIPGSQAEFLREHLFDGLLLKPVDSVLLRRILHRSCQPGGGRGRGVGVGNGITNRFSTEFGRSVREEEEYVDEEEEGEEQQEQEEQEQQEMEEEVVRSWKPPRKKFSWFNMTDLMVRIPGFIGILLMHWVSPWAVTLLLAAYVIPVMMWRDTHTQDHNTVFSLVIIVLIRLVVGSEIGLEGLFLIVWINATHLHEVSVFDFVLVLCMSVCYAVMGVWPVHGLLDIPPYTQWLLSLLNSIYVLGRLFSTSMIHRKIMNAHLQAHVKSLVKCQIRLSEHLQHVAKTVHDARDPLESLAVLLDDLSRFADGQVLARSARRRVREMIFCAKRATLSCRDYIDNLSSLFQIRYEKMTTVETNNDLLTLVDSCVEELHSLNGVSLDPIAVQILPYLETLSGVSVLLDAKKFRRIVHTFVEYASAAVSRLGDKVSDGTIRFSCFLDRRDSGSFLKLVVRDNGIHLRRETGFVLPQELSEELALNVESLLGIAWAVSVNFARMLGGTIVSFEDGSWTVQELLLPLKEGESEKKVETEGKKMMVDAPVFGEGCRGATLPGQLSRFDECALNCVVVDDGRVQRMVMEKFLHSLSHSNVWLCEDFAQARVTISHLDRLDFLFVDLNLKMSSGLDVANFVRKVFPECYVVLVTGEILGPNWSHRDVNECLMKPFRREDFEEILRGGQLAG